MSRLLRLRKRAGGALMKGFFEGLARAGGVTPAARPRAHGVERIRDIPYAGSGARHHLLDVYRPTDRGPLRPVVVYLHGGAFRMLSKDTHWVMGLGFARRGYVVFNINYRLAPQHRYPAAVEDACDAVRWVLRNAAAFGGDPERIIYAGESAGGNLAAALAAASCYRRPEPWARALFDAEPRVQAVIAACGMLQVTDPHRFARRKARMGRFVADRLIEASEGYLPPERAGLDLDLADPLLLFERGEAPDRPLPPFFAFAGTRDPLLSDTRRLARALRRMGVDCEDRYYPGGLHAFHAMVMDPRARTCWKHQYAFLDRLLG